MKSVFPRLQPIMYYLASMKLIKCEAWSRTVSRCSDSPWVASCFPSGPYPLRHSWTKWFCLQEPFFLGSIFPSFLEYFSGFFNQNERPIFWGLTCIFPSFPGKFSEFLYIFPSFITLYYFRSIFSSLSIFPDF